MQLPVLPPDVPADDPEGPSLRDVARLLATPARSGVPFTRERLGQIASRLELPLSFGDRPQQFASLIRAAAELDRLPELLTALHGEVERWRGVYQGWSDEFPASQDIWLSWSRRLDRATDLLSQMESVLELGKAGDQADPGQPATGR